MTRKFKTIEQSQLLNPDKTAKQMRRMMQEYYTIIRHEIRAPLAAIRGYTELLLNDKVGPLNEEQEEWCLTALRNSSENVMDAFENYANFCYQVISGDLYLEADSDTREDLLRMEDRHSHLLRHEVIAPLLGIRGCSEFLLRGEVGPLNEKQKECLTALRKLTENVTNTFEDYAKFYGAISGVFFLDEVDLREILLHLRLDGVNIYIPNNLPKILGDGQHLQQALKNIFTEVFPGCKVGAFKPSLKISYDNDWVTIKMVTLEELTHFNDNNYAQPSLFYSQVVVEEHGGQFRFRKAEDKVEIFLLLPITQDQTTA